MNSLFEQNHFETMESNECLVYELDIDPKTVCRICLGQPTVLSNVFSQSIVDGYLVAVPDIITYTLDINVSASLTHLDKSNRIELIGFYI